jgi:hypothetical protein
MSYKAKILENRVETSKFKILIDNTYIEKEYPNEFIYCKVDSIYITLKDDLHALNNFTSISKLEKYYSDNRKLLDTTKIILKGNSYSIIDYINKTNGALKLQYYFKLYKKIKACEIIHNAYRHYKFKTFVNGNLKKLAIIALKEKMKRNSKVSFTPSKSNYFESARNTLNLNDNETNINHFVTETSTLDTSTRRVYTNILSEMNSPLETKYQPRPLTFDLSSKTSSINDTDLCGQVNALNQEVKQLKNEKLLTKDTITKLKESHKDKEKYIEVLEEKLKVLKEVVVKCEEDFKICKFSKNKEEVDKLKEDLCLVKRKNDDYEIHIEILNLKLEEFSKLNTELNNVIHQLKEQDRKRKTLYDNEINKLFELNVILEKEKIERRSCDIDYDLSPLNKDGINMNNKLQLGKANVNLNKKLEDQRNNNLSEINKLKSDLSVKDITIKNLLDSLQAKDNEIISYQAKIKDLYEQILKGKETIRQYQLKAYNEPSWKNDFDSTMKKKETELSSLKETLEVTFQSFEKSKKLELAFKNELGLKDIELAKRNEVISSIQNELNKLNEENIVIRRENISFKTKFDLLVDLHVKAELNNKIKEIVILKETIFRKEKEIEDLEFKLVSKNTKFEGKVKMNTLLTDIISLKKTEILCLEALKYTESKAIKENLANLRSVDIELNRKLDDLMSKDEYDSHQTDSESSAFQGNKYLTKDYYFSDEEE